MQCFLLETLYHYLFNAGTYTIKYLMYNIYFKNNINAGEFVYNRNQ